MKIPDDYDLELIYGWMLLYFITTLRIIGGGVGEDTLLSLLFLAEGAANLLIGYYLGRRK